MKKKQDNTSAISVKFLAVSLLFAAALFLFGFIADEVVLEQEDLFDTQVFNFLAQHSTPSLIKAAQVLTFFGSSLFFLPAYSVIVLYFLAKRQRAYALDIALLGVSSTVLLNTLKNSFRRQRPEHPIFTALTNYSFPSGHALSSFIFCSVLIYIVWNSSMKMGWKWALAIFFFLFAIGIGLSRIVLRYHYASDVLAGFCLGFAWALFSLWLLKQIRKRFRKTEPAQQDVSPHTQA